MPIRVVAFDAWAHEHAEAPRQRPQFRSFESARHVVGYLLP